MPSTYLQLTNRLLRRLQDVEIPQADFASATGIQATAKDAILDTVREINTSKIDWPFNAVEHSQYLQVGVEEYGWPSAFVAADWNSFQIQKDDTLQVIHRALKVISREEWYMYLRDRDYDTETTGMEEPIYAFPSHGSGWGVSPSPDQEYLIKYRYYKNPTDLDAYDDEVTIPSRFDYVIIAGALWHMNIFKENIEGAQLMRQSFEKGIQNMVAVFLPNPIHMIPNLANPGNGSHTSRPDRFGIGV